MPSIIFKVLRRAQLSWSEKLTIRVESKRRNVAGGCENLSSIAEWASKLMKLRQRPSYRTILRIIRDEDRIRVQATSTHFRMKKGLKVRSATIESIKVAWVWKMSKNEVFVTDIIIMEKARKTQLQINATLPEEEQTQLQFSYRWLSKFKIRNCFKRYRSHGESGDADHDAILNELPILQTLLSAFSPRDTFNADEFGLNYQLAPTSTVGPRRLPGRKKKKERLTFLVCGNADGSEQIAPHVFGSSRKPRCFRGMTSTEHGLYYRSNKKACMNRIVFYEWLNNFNEYVKIEPGRRVVLLIDNASGHGQIDVLPILSNVVVLFLPRNTTSQLQPLDSGLIATVKTRYKKFLVKQAVDRMESGICTNLYSIDLLIANRKIYEIWDNMEKDIVQKWWLKTHIRSHSGQESNSQ